MHVVHGNRRDPGAIGHRDGDGAADHQRADEARSGRVGDAGQLADPDAGRVEHAADHRRELRDVIARRELRDDAAKGRVHVDLARQRIGDDSGARHEDRGTGLVAAGLYAEDRHRRFTRRVRAGYYLRLRAGS
jgi:hypothetical protein